MMSSAGVARARLWIRARNQQRCGHAELELFRPLLGARKLPHVVGVGTGDVGLYP